MDMLRHTLLRYFHIIFSIVNMAKWNKMDQNRLVSLALLYLHPLKRATNIFKQNNFIDRYFSKYYIFIICIFFKI